MIKKNYTDTEKSYLMKFGMWPDALESNVLIEIESEFAQSLLKKAVDDGKPLTDASIEKAIEESDYDTVVKDAGDKSLPGFGAKK